MNLTCIQIPPLGTNCYFVLDGKTLGIVDPGGEADHIIDYIEKEGFKPCCILLTHGHFDHAGAAGALKERYTIPIYIHALDAPMLQNAETSHAARFGFPYEGCTADVLLEDGDTVNVGMLTFTLLHTPGHTAGSSCFFGEDVLLSGDTLFAGTVGRFERKDKEALKNSVRRLLALPEDTAVFPGHEGQTTILQEKRTNPFANFDWEWE